MRRDEFIKLALTSAAALSLPGFGRGDDKAEVCGKIVELKGAVTVAGQPAKINAKVRQGEEIVVGPDSQATVKFKDESVLELRADTRTTVRLAERSVLLELVAGAALAIFAEGDHEVRTPTSVAGVRGTSMFTKVENVNQVYHCVCRGTVDFKDRAQGVAARTVVSDYHQAVRVVRDGAGPRIEEAPPKLDHTDEQLNHLLGLHVKPYNPWKPSPSPGKNDDPFDYGPP